MKALTIAAMLVVLGASPSFAQAERGYIAGGGGFAVSTDTTSGNVMGEAGVRIAPHLLVFGELGQFHNLQPSDAQPSIDTTTTELSDSIGLGIVGTARVPALYSVGGLRFEVPTHSRFSPYILGGVGAARLKPTIRYTFASGALPDGTTPSVGDDVTTQLMTQADVTIPTASTEFMYTLGGGVNVPVARHWAIDAGYRFSRVQADTPVNAQGATFGLGYRF